MFSPWSSSTWLRARPARGRGGGAPHRRARSSKLTAKCDLGDPGRHFGWQCKWWKPPGRIYSNRRKALLKAFADLPEHLPGLTDFVLWTHEALSDVDLKWLRENAPSGVCVHSWHADDINDLLVGDAELLREVYFGTKVYTPKIAEEAFAESAATLQDRYLPQVHVDVRQEAILRAGLGVPGEWRRLGRLADRARATCDELRRLGSPRRTIEGYEQWVAEPSAAAVAWGELAPEALEVLEERGPGYAVEVAELAEGFGFDESAELDSRVVAHMRAHGMTPAGTSRRSMPSSPPTRPAPS